MSPPTLVLVPTDLERRRLADHGGWPQERARVELCGFGPVAAAARTSQLLARRRPPRVLLVGIAGTYAPEAHGVGEAVAFGRVALDGVGVGQAELHRGPSALGFPQWPGSSDTTPSPIGEELSTGWPNAGEPGPLLVTTCAASGDAAEAALRRERWPGAAGEDMEAWGVAMACALADVPFAVVRGFSNEVGVREPTEWRIPQALLAARRLALELLETEPEEQP